MSDLLDLRIFFWLVLPVVVGLAVINDPNKDRAQVWFYMGAAVIVGSMIWLG